MALSKKFRHIRSARWDFSTACISLAGGECSIRKRFNNIRCISIVSLNNTSWRHSKQLYLNNFSSKETQNTPQKTQVIIRPTLPRLLAETADHNSCSEEEENLEETSEYKKF